jgi:hypothetical protein
MQHQHNQQVTKASFNLGSVKLSISPAFCFFQLRFFITANSGFPLNPKKENANTIQ